MCLASAYYFAASPPEHYREIQRIPPLYVKLSGVRLGISELGEKKIRILFEWRECSRLAPIIYVRWIGIIGFRIEANAEPRSNTSH